MMQQMTTGQRYRAKNPAPPRPPLYISLLSVARFMGVSKETARGRLMREGALLKRDGRWCTTRRLLQRAYPEVLDEMMFYDDED